MGREKPRLPGEAEALMDKSDKANVMCKDPGAGRSGKSKKRSWKERALELHKELREDSWARQGWGQGDGKAVKTTGRSCT